MKMLIALMLFSTSVFAGVNRTLELCFVNQNDIVPVVVKTQTTLGTNSFTLEREEESCLLFDTSIPVVTVSATSFTDNTCNPLTFYPSRDPWMTRIHIFIKGGMNEITCITDSYGPFEAKMQQSDCVDYAKNEIQQYLNVHPKASDTIEGIHAWWIQWPRPESIVCTDLALRNLESEGIVESFLAGSRVVWRKTRNF